MKVKRRTETTIEAHEFWVARRPREPSAAWCGECATDAVMLPPEDAARLTNVTPRMIYRWVEAGRIHFTETGGGGLLVCLASMPAADAAPVPQIGGPPTQD